MKLSDVVAKFLKDQGIYHVFAISGGASLHLIHSIAETDGIEFVCPQHEQSAAFAADAYSRVTGNLGCAVATSGPGATNLITGIAGAYYDSVPVLFLTGQVATFRSKKDTGVRQIGFQETEIVEMCSSVTKYGVLIKDPYEILYEIGKALHIAKIGRPGPVLVDIPDDIQRMDVDETKLKRYIHCDVDKNDNKLDNELSAIDRTIELLKESERPVLIYGWGVHLARAQKEAIELSRLLGIPMAFTWAARDLFDSTDPLVVGGFGTHGTRPANYAVQNADLIISVGSRLDTKATGTPPSSFAREAKRVMVDIDPTEINKFKQLQLNIDVPINLDAAVFLKNLLNKLSRERLANEMPKYNNWVTRINRWKSQYPIYQQKDLQDKEINPYWFVEQLSLLLNEGEIIFADTGCALAWMMQGFIFKKEQRFFHAFNSTPMGYALPGAIGAAFAKPNQKIICITGDGSLQMNIQELATIAHHKLPVKIILFNNHGHAMVRQTQDMWLNGNHFATSTNNGLPDPNFIEIAKAYGFRTEFVQNSNDCVTKIEHILTGDDPCFVNVEINAQFGVYPQVRFGRPNEDAEPLLGREEFLSNMLIKALPISLS